MSLETKERNALDTKERIAQAVKAADGKKAEDAAVLDLRGLSAVTDYFVVLSGGSTTQVRAIADGIREALSEKGIEPLGTEGYNDGTWILLDYVDFIAHVFHREKRIFYALENLWSDAPRLRKADLKRGRKTAGKRA